MYTHLHKMGQCFHAIIQLSDAIRSQHHISYFTELNATLTQLIIFILNNSSEALNQNRLQSFARNFADISLSLMGVPKIPCSCSVVYIGQAGRSIKLMNLITKLFDRKKS